MATGRDSCAFDPAEHPVALQLGGSDPDALAAAARIGEDARLRRDQPQRRLPIRPGAERPLRGLPDGASRRWSPSAWRR